ncbi:MAG: hypothetical protein NTY96_03475 [Bacteroidetes bacterium]|nr:hypothetical protein [Bacteroidota bacterium]
MKTIANPVILILCLILFYSCSNIPQVSRKKVIGSWKVDQMVSIGGVITDSTDLKTVATQNKPPDLSGRELKNTMVDAQKGNFSRFKDVCPDLKDAMEFNADNTATLTIHGKSISGTWQMNEKSNGVIFTGSDKIKVLKVNIAEVTSNSMQVDEPSPLGLVRLSYNKEKK